MVVVVIFVCVCVFTLLFKFFLLVCVRVEKNACVHDAGTAQSVRH